MLSSANLIGAIELRCDSSHRRGALICALLLWCSLLRGRQARCDSVAREGRNQRDRFPAIRFVWAAAMN